MSETQEEMVDQEQVKNGAAILSLWNENQLQLGIPVVDLQHIWLIAIVLDLDEIISRGVDSFTGEFHDRVVDVIDYTWSHFILEEDLIQRFRFPQADNHMQQHRKFVELLNRRVDEFRGGDLSAAGKLVENLKGWLFNHIKVEDKKYQQFFEDEGVAVREYTQQLIADKRVNINRIQAALYSQITSSTEIREIINEDLADQVRGIWRSYDLAIHIPIIDIQHIWLVRLVVELDNANRTKRGERKTEVFNMVVANAVEYTKEHFRTEEILMQRYGFPDMASHVRQHRSFVEFILQRNKENREGDPMAASHLVQDLKEWLLSHIAHEDKKLRQFFRGRNSEVREFVKQLVANRTLVLKNGQVRLYKQIMLKK